jgi:transcription elongation factor Elf1
LRISAGDKRKFDCPNCGPKRNTIVKSCYHKSGETEDFSWNSNYLIVECAACDVTFFGEVHTNSEDIEYYFEDDNQCGHYNETISQWPVSAKKVVEPAWLDEIYRSQPDLHEILKDTYFVMNEGRNFFAAIGFRTCIDRICEEVGIDPAITFEAKTQELLKLGKISQTNKEQIDAAIDAGSAAVHRGWKPEFEHIDAVRMTVEALIFSLFVNPERMSKLRTATPAKQKRQKKK